jgi:TonB family protein
MSGVKIDQARNALRALVHGLNPQDSFNIIRFSSDFSSFAPQPAAFAQQNVDQADLFIDQLAAQGGTEMLPALRFALTQPRSQDKLPLVVLLTDGQVGNEQQILEALEKHLGNARLYTFGIGTALNDYLLRAAARRGRGTVEFVSPYQDLEEVIGRFQSQVASPLLTDVSLEWNGLPVDAVHPTPVPDLFRASPLVVYGRASQPVSRTITVSGQSVNGPVRFPLQVDLTRSTTDAATLALLWARGRIEALNDRLYVKPDEPQTKDQIIELALHHHLMSPFTAFVAVEEKLVASPDGGPPKTVVVPVPLPESWDYDAVFGKGGLAMYSLSAATAYAVRVQAAPTAGIGTGSGGGVGSGSGPGVGPGFVGSSGGGAFRIGGSVSAPTCIYCPGPEYSDEARKAQHRGVVLLHAIVDEKGNASSIRVQKSLGMGLDQAAVRAVQNWRFKPAQRSGKPVPVYVNVDVNFHLGDDAGDVSSSLSFGRGTRCFPDVTWPHETLVVSLKTKEEQVTEVARYLLRHQRVDGTWSDKPGDSMPADDVQTTAFALLAYLGQGHTDRAGHYQAQVRRAMDHLIGSLGPSGELTKAKGQVKTHALLLWALAESYGATGSARYREAATSVAGNLMDSRTINGLWPARSVESADPATTVWALIALQAAQRAGLPVRDEASATAAQAMASLPDASPVHLALAQLLASEPSPSSTPQEIEQSIAAYTSTISNITDTESAALALLAARLLGNKRTLETAEEAVLAALGRNQQTQGKAAGAFDFCDGHAVAASARSYLLLVAGQAKWRALQ